MNDAPLWEKWLQPLFQAFLIDQSEIDLIYQSVDWNWGEKHFKLPDHQSYPHYYQGQNFHGIEGGYLTKAAAVTYDPITRYVLPPHEDWVRQGLIDQVGGYPSTILDLGSGTGSMALALKRAFPRATVTGLDLSPHMLSVAAYKARNQNLAIHWQAGLAEATGLAGHQFDVVTATLLFHETPPTVAIAILREAWRLLKSGGQILILDGNQRNLRQQPWLTEVFEEPFIRDYAQGDVQSWLQEAKFEAIATQEHWWFHQISQARKPLLYQKVQPSTVNVYSPVGIATDLLLG